MVDSKTGQARRGRVIEVFPGLAARLRPVDDDGLTVLTVHFLAEDKTHIVKEINGNEVY